MRKARGLVEMDLNWLWMGKLLAGKEVTLPIGPEVRGVGVGGAGVQEGGPRIT